MAKKHKHPEHVNHERWLVSYADFITLLFAFFVVLFSASQVDRSKSKKMALAIESAFERFSIFKHMSGDTDVEGQGGSGGAAKRYREYLVESEDGSPIIIPPVIEYGEASLKPPQADPKLDYRTGMLSGEKEALARVQQELLDLIKNKKLDSSVETKWDDRGVVISIREAGMFLPGSKEFTPSSLELLKGIGSSVSSLPNQIRVEGHTSTDPPNENYETNWSLATERANHVIKWLIEAYGIQASRLISVGYGQNRPIATNETENGRFKNNRIDVVVLSEKASEKEAPIYNMDQHHDKNSEKEKDIGEQTPLKKLIENQ